MKIPSLHLLNADPLILIYMWTIEYAKKFKRDYKRETKGTHKNTLAIDIQLLIQLLQNNVVLPTHYCDHALKGDWKDHRDLF